MTLTLIDRHKAAMAAGAAVVALLAGVVLPVEAYLALVALLVLALIGLVALSAQARKPTFGLALLVGTAVVFPFEFRGPAGVMMSSSLPLATGLCGIWIARSLVVRGSIPLDTSRVVYAALAFMGTALLAFGSGQYPWFPAGGAPLPAQIAELGLFLVSGCLFLAAGHQVTSLAQLQRLTWILVAAGTVTAILQSVPALAFIARWTTRPGTVGSLFWTWLTAMAVAQALFNRSLRVPVRLALLGVGALVLGHGLIQVRSWASGWLPPVVALCAIALLKAPRLTIGLAIVAIPLGLVAGDYVSGALVAEEEYSLMTRTEAWRVLWQIVERNPIIGTGPANYYYYTENFPLLGWYVRFISHNNYQDLIIQTGIAGLLAFCWFACEAGWLALRLSARLPEGFARAYVVGAFGALAGSLSAGMLGDWIVPFYYNGGILGFRSSLLFWVFLGGVLAIKRMTTAAALSYAPQTHAYGAPAGAQLAEAR